MSLLHKLAQHNIFLKRCPYLWLFMAKHCCCKICLNYTRRKCKGPRDNVRWVWGVDSVLIMYAGKMATTFKSIARNQFLSANWDHVKKDQILFYWACICSLEQTENDRVYHTSHTGCFYFFKKNTDYNHWYENIHHFMFCGSVIYTTTIH